MSTTKIADLPSWFDRNPAMVLKAWSAGNIAPHATTIRWTYTVPSDRYAYMEFFDCFLRRQVAAVTPGEAFIEIRVTPKGESVSRLVAAYLFSESKDIKDENRVWGAQSMILLPETVLTGSSGDSCIGGTINYSTSAKFTEFDAITRIHQEPLIEPPKPDIQVPQNGNDCMHPWWWPF